MTDWQPISTAPSDTVVDTKIHDARGARNFAPLKRSGSLWWTPDGFMHVYYSPTHWKPRTELQETP